MSEDKRPEHFRRYLKPLEAPTREATLQYMLQRHVPSCCIKDIQLAYVKGVTSVAQRAPIVVDQFIKAAGGDERKGCLTLVAKLDAKLEFWMQKRFDEDEIRQQRKKDLATDVLILKPQDTIRLTHSYVYHLLGEFEFTVTNDKPVNVLRDKRIKVKFKQVVQPSHSVSNAETVAIHLEEIRLMANNLWRTASDKKSEHHVHFLLSYVPSADEVKEVVHSVIPKCSVALINLVAQFV